MMPYLPSKNNRVHLDSPVKVILFARPLWPLKRPKPLYAKLVQARRVEEGFWFV
jgi:hypothetical protein